MPIPVRVAKAKRGRPAAAARPPLSPVSAPPKKSKKPTSPKLVVPKKGGGRKRPVGSPGPPNPSPPSKRNRVGGGGGVIRTIGKRLQMTESGSGRDREGGSDKKKKKKPSGQFQHTISTSSMGILNSLMNDLFERLATEASRLSKLNRKSTIGSREIRTACQLIMRGDVSSK